MNNVSDEIKNKIDKKKSHIIQSLWIGDSISTMEILSMKSFLFHNHTYHLYTYNPIENIPDGVVIKDANEIIPKDQIYTYENGSYSAFSNLFRFTLLWKCGGYWADTDLICVKSFKFTQPYVIVSEPTQDYNSQLVTSSFIGLPKKSMTAYAGINFQKKIKHEILDGTLKWGAGPKCMNKIVNNYKLQKYILPWNTVNSCGWNDIQSIVDTSYKPKSNSVITNINNIPDNMICIHMWNYMWTLKNFNKNSTFHHNSLYEQLKKKFLVDSSNESINTWYFNTK